MTDKDRTPGRLRSIFWRPPRAHGDVIEDRTVSFLELFYDLVYVVVIARVAHHLATHVTWRGLAEFAVVFGLIWLAWLNGTMFYELHGREDVRTRVFVFAQMLLLALLAVFTEDATGADGRAFALTYTAFLSILAWLWISVRRQDDERYRRTTGMYVAGMVVSIALIAFSGWLDDDARLIVWGAFVVAWLASSFLMERSAGSTENMGLVWTDSMVERFGLFTIIVLGEVVVGVVEGLSEAERSSITVVTGLIGLAIGFAYWWTYFDFVGRRLPRPEGLTASRWTISHLPVTMSIAASGAAMVSLVEHARDDRAPEATAWLLTGSAAVGLIGLIAVMTVLRDYDRLRWLYSPLTTAMTIAAAALLAVGWWRPSPWMLVTAVLVIFTGVWLVGVRQWLQHRSDQPI